MQEFDTDSNRDKRTFIRCFCGLLIVDVLLLVLFIVSLVFSMKTVAAVACPGVIALLQRCDIHHVYVNGKPTNESFVDLEYLINNKIYKNTTTLLLTQIHNLQEILSNKGAIYVYEGCGNDSFSNYYLDQTYMNGNNVWVAFAGISGFLFGILAISLVLSLIGLYLSNRNLT